MHGTSGPTRRSSRLRLGLLLTVVIAAGVLAVAIVADPRRLDVFADRAGRTAAPDERGWVRVALAPAALTEVAAAVHQERIWVAGGLDGAGRAVDLVLIYDPTSDSWTKGPPLPVAVHHSALVSNGDALFLIGGYSGDGFGRPTDAVYRLREDGGWAPDEPLPEPRGAGAAAFDGRGRIMYGGGVGPAGVSAGVFMQDGRGWFSIASLSEAREHLAATSAGAGSVTFLGGRVGGLDGNLGTVEFVSNDGVVGRTEDLPTARGGIAAFSTGTLGACVVGGEGPNGTFGNVECVGAFEVTTLPGLTVPRHGLGAVFLDGRAYVLLGGPQPGLTVSDVVEVLDLR